MKDNSLLLNIISKLHIRISLYQVIAWNGVASLLVFTVTQRKFSTWPMIDLIPHLQRLENHNSILSSTDYFYNSTLSNSGRAPFVFTGYAILNILKISPETYLALLSSILITIGPIIVMITFLQTRKRIIPGQKFFTILDCLVLVIMQYLLARYAPRLALAGYSSTIFNQGMVPATLSITLTSVGIIGFTNTRITLLKYISGAILYLAIVIHPATSLMFLIFWISLKALHKNLESLKLVLWPIILGGLTVIFLLRNDINRMTGSEFVQIYADLRHPHHYWPSYFYSEIFLRYFIIALIFVTLIRIVCRLGQPFKHSSMLFSYVFVIIIFQYLFVEILPVLQFAQSSITRGFVYIGFAFCTFFFWIYEDLVQRIVHNSSTAYVSFKTIMKSVRFFSIFIATTLLILVFNTTTSKTLTEFHLLRNNVVKELDELGIQPYERVLLDMDGVDSSGWREYGKVSIWLDSYFPFDMKSISLYRLRWLQLCGPNRINNCDFSENRLTKIRLVEVTREGDIDVIVLKKSETRFDSSDWKPTRVSNLYVAYRRDEDFHSFSAS